VRARALLDEAGGPDSIDWTYDPASSVGPDNWGANVDPDCNGNAQTPIDLSSSVGINSDLPPLDAITSVDSECKTYKGEVNQATWAMSGMSPRCKEGGQLTLSWDGATYVMHHVHLHSPSEHTIDGKQFPAEAHLVFLAEDGGVGPVIGVMLDVPSWPAPAADYIGGNQLWLDQFVFDNKEHALKAPFNPFADLLPADKKYFHYTGSYTTPMCKDGVVPWIVLRTPAQMSYAQLVQYKAALFTLPKTAASLTNNRPVQPLNGRTVELSPAA